MSTLDEQEKDRLKAQKIANTKADEILKEMDICDPDHSEYGVYKYQLRFHIYSAIKIALKL